MNLPTISPTMEKPAETGRTETLKPAEGAQLSSAPAAEFKLKKILVAVDFSDCSKAALQEAVAVARQFGAALTVLNVVQPYPMVAEMAAVDMAMIQSDMEDAAEKEMETLMNGIPGDVKREGVLRVGNPHHEVAKVAQELGVDLIVIATHGRTGLAHVFMGSTAECTVRHAKCPVLVVRGRQSPALEPIPAPPED